VRVRGYSSLVLDISGAWISGVCTMGEQRAGEEEEKVHKCTVYTMLGAPAHVPYLYLGYIYFCNGQLRFFRIGCFVQFSSDDE